MIYLTLKLWNKTRYIYNAIIQVHHIQPQKYNITHCDIIYNNFIIIILNGKYLS